MQQLPNNCRMGSISVTPKNWQSPKANVHLKWKIGYWFYDDNLKQRKQIVIQRTNRFYQVHEKQNTVRSLIENEITGLKKGKNPITKAI